MSDGGKGSSPRPFSIANDEYAKRWDAIFSRDLKQEEDQKIEDEAFNLVEKQNREKALDELVRINEELGLYDEPEDKLTRYNEETQAVKK
jgi:hypothetical protein